MSIDIIPTRGREVLAEAIAALNYLCVISAGDPAWDAMWDSGNPPTGNVDAVDVIAPIGFARPTVVGFVKVDPAGSISDSGGTKYSVSATVTRFVRIRLSIPVGALPSQNVREVGVFAKAVFDSDVLPGQTMIPAGDVLDRGKLLLLAKFRPQFLSAGTSFARNLIVRL